jgi:hypothetical protein
MQEGLKTLETLLDPYDWFYEACIEGLRYVVYVHRMGPGVEDQIPDQIAGKQVVVHFAASKNVQIGQYVKTPGILDISQMAEYLGQAEEEELVSEELSSSFLQLDLSDLCKELDRLEKICGSNILQDVFYEIHDGKNAVTNLRAKFPDVHRTMMKLYDEYGFSTIYEELDG